MGEKRIRRTPSHGLTRKVLDSLVEEATIDCYNEEEQATGLFTMIEEHLELPFHTKVLGVQVSVERIEITDEGEVVALCRRGREKQVFPLLSLPLPSPPPVGFEWIEAYRRWRRGYRMTNRT